MTRELWGMGAWCLGMDDMTLQAQDGLTQNHQFFNTLPDSPRVSYTRTPPPIIYETKQLIQLGTPSLVPPLKLAYLQY